MSQWDFPVSQAWRPRGGRSKYAKDLEPGMIVAIDYAGFRHKPWRLHEIRVRDDERVRLYLRPVGEQYDFAEFNNPITAYARTFIPVLDEHYSVCGKCGDLQPCAEVWSERVARDAAEHAARYEMEGVCPACQEPVTARQKSHTFEENLHALIGPPVTFHKRAKCWRSAVNYDAELAKRHKREPALSCGGWLIHHRDNHYQCSSITCPGTDKSHGSYARCYVLKEKCNRPECWALEES